MAERNYLSIGQVVNLLRGAYPDLSNSKIRFLEDEGLITPHRTPKGYRQYSKEDVDRLEVILHLQKTRYMPLNVIKQRLENATDLSTLAYEVGLLSDVPLKTEPKETKQKLHPIETIPDMLGVEISFIRSLAENDLIRIIKARRTASSSMVAIFRSSVTAPSCRASISSHATCVSTCLPLTASPRCLSRCS